MMSLERQINLDNQREIMETMELFQNQLDEIQAEENAKAGAEKEQTRITQGEPSRRGDNVSTDTRSKQKPESDVNPRPTKRRGGRTSGGDRGGRPGSDRGGRTSGSDRGGRTSGGDCGGRSGGSSRGGRALPPF
ncbi:uncharacterized protein DR_0269-like [Impatiens glandulifera]|uniref:uncharacterized protein DR_0269-like n=1 Tax=Impatiens glandulifera TaxID=253017 RepID=UPI001FB0D557|nr:uncharacterized protein DR_0269-like [Impatiens glandulifera]